MFKKELFMDLLLEEQLIVEPEQAGEDLRKRRRVIARRFVPKQSLLSRRLMRLLRRFAPRNDLLDYLKTKTGK
jgi:hypothetical protein